MWRIVIGLSLIPAFATLYQRLTLPESTRFLASQKRPTEEEQFEDLKKANNADEDVAKDEVKTGTDSSINQSAKADPVEAAVQKKAQFSGEYSGAKA